MNLSTNFGKNHFLFYLEYDQVIRRYIQEEQGDILQMCHSS